MADAFDDGVAKQVTLLVQNATPTTIFVASSMLWGNGTWEPGGAPIHGQNFGYGATFVAGVTTPYDTFGGQVSLTPSTGGTILISWNWAAGTPVAPSSSAGSTNLDVTCWTADTSTAHPTVYFQITPV
jgi:hypothetical protein